MTVNSERYCVLLDTFLRPKLAELDYKNNIWLYQGVATARTSRRSTGILTEIFPGQLISLRGDISWPAQSSDLNPCDFFSVGILKIKGLHSSPSIY